MKGGLWNYLIFGSSLMLCDYHDGYDFDFVLFLFLLLNE